MMIKTYDFMNNAANFAQLQQSVRPTDNWMRLKAATKTTENTFYGQ